MEGPLRLSREDAPAAEEALHRPGRVLLRGEERPDARPRAPALLGLVPLEDARAARPLGFAPGAHDGRGARVLLAPVRPANPGHPAPSSALSGCGGVPTHASGRSPEGVSHRR